jgi:hypothetical protein
MTAAAEQRIVRRWLGGLLVGASLLRLWLGWHFFGFLTGDDVEIAEAGFRAIGLRYAPWAIRNTLVSDALVGPWLAVLRGLGVIDRAALVWAASWPMVACATASIYLLFRLVAAWTGRPLTALAAAWLYGLHWIALGFGSATFPRPVSTTCVLAAALCVARAERPAWRDLAAGGCIALAFAVRYSEVIFLAPVALLAAAGLAGWRAQCRVLLGVAAGFAAGALLFVGAYEALTWGRPFAALLAFARYTLLEKQASALVVRQPCYWYLWRLPHWWCVAGLPLLAGSSRGRGERRLLWAWAFVLIPLAVLSYIHHKELRYLQGVVPFLCALAAAGAAALWQAGWRRTAALLFALCLGWHLARLTFLTSKSMPAVLAARALAAEPRIATVAGVQLWALGDRLYLGNERALRELPYPTRAADLPRLAPGADAVVLYTRDLRAQPDLAHALAALGFCPWRDFAFGGSAKAVSVLRPCPPAVAGP